MFRVTLEALALPDSALSANNRRRLGYWNVAQVTRLEHKAWYFRLVEQVQAISHSLPLDRVHLTWELTYPTRRIPDDDNVLAALKPVRDTLCVAKPGNPDGWYLGIILDDSPKHIVSTTLVQQYERGVRRTRITLEEVG